MTKFKRLLDLKIHSIKFIAKSVFRSVDMIAKYAAGRSEPTAKTSQAIADLFGVSHKWLWCQEGNIDDLKEEKKYVQKDLSNRIQGKIDEENKKAENEGSFEGQKV